MTWQESMAADMRSRGLSRTITRERGEANVLVEYLGEVYRNMSGHPREIETHVDWILAGRIAQDLGDGAVVTHTLPSGAARRWEHCDGCWTRLA